ncbi:two-component sensor histidine kinase [Alsobacter metallidurans]|uniref:histidine kinase n=1 Tax=Alsobacter metallidurans TaxID=340221 RepID=A0A917I6D6_9HYPH|nr:ATP-binding protein [Alsobacter metallidurans]GGH14028.1 two-component sensor histidine kinase [Alsobacter metallidurans]
MTALGKLFRTTAFKLSLAYLVIFTLFAFFLLGYIAFNARRLIADQVASVVEAETQGLAEQYMAGGLRRLVEIIEQRSRQPGASLYLVMGPGGDKLAGNIGQLPPDLLNQTGQRQIAYFHNDDDRRPHMALVRIYDLPSRVKLLVGHDLAEADRLRSVIRRAFGWSLSLVVILALLGGWFVTRRVLGRIDAMTDTTRGIMEGNLSGRLALSGSNDELDRLAVGLNAMLDRIEELMTGLKEVSDNIAHDLKTPLTRLRNGAEQALRTAQSPDDYRQALEGTIEEADNLIRVFNALLMIARAEAGSAHDGVSDFDLAEMARDVVELYEPVAEEAGVPLTLDVPPGLRLKGSRELVGQALANLVDNAIKYAPRPLDPGAAPNAQPGVRVSAATRGDAVEIAVADGGPGIPAADRNRVLERFVRLEGARTRPGFGLGLSLAAAVARLHGGVLRLEDNEPGLRAVVALPLPSGGA